LKGAASGSTRTGTSTNLHADDRPRWRAQRQQTRLREYQEDIRDRHREEEESRALEQESEEFLKRQLVDMAEMEGKNRQAGLLTEDAAPIRLALKTALPEVKEEVPSKPKPNVTFDGDEDEEDAAAKKKRTLVKLEYDGGGFSEAEQVAKRNARLLEIRASIPRDRKSIWSLRIEWAAVNEVGYRLTLLISGCITRQNSTLCARTHAESIGRN
jgi:RNA-binding protein 25